MSSANYFKTLLYRQLAGFRRTLSSEAVWIVPAGLGAGWLLWPAMDHEWKMELGLARDPDAEMFKVQEMKKQRYEAKFGKSMDAKDEDEEEEDEPEDDEEEKEDGPEEEAPEEESEEEGIGGGDDDANDTGDDDDDAAGDDEEEEEEEEESPIQVPPLYVPTKGKLTPEQVWDNYTIRAVNWLADDDDDEDEEDDE
ncbi:hypothetical protein MPSEU_000417100 [Mayamaea pseudoterrestris]|nr:hypothetical protein MPSEU_000417100 [Mayamaea pseudoterrestris]